LDGLVLDVKSGSGAFMPSHKQSQVLAKSLVTVANGAGVETSALLTDMNEPLATAAGNAIEMKNAVDFLTGDHIDPRNWEITVALGAEMLRIAKLVETFEDGVSKMEDAYRSGAATEKFSHMVTALGGAGDFVEKMDKYLTLAPKVVDIITPKAGYVEAINTRRIGIAVVELGGGRRKASDEIDHSVGLDNLAGIGDKIEQDQPIARVYAHTDDQVKRAMEMVQQAYQIGESKIDSRAVYETITG
ncbi:MAG TPA: thymidine phosphorylase, partial [Rhizobiales bacterium]|nr:thymidine phosphorylase [Hyphomicrobiales bacterium]